MLARRFTVIVLLATLLGMALALIAAGTALPANSFERASGGAACAPREGWVCIGR